MTTTKIKIMIISASSNRRSVIDVESSTPIPPAPTRPRITADRTAFSTLKRLVPTNEANPIGKIDPDITPSLEPPVDSSASDGPFSISSIRSEKKRAQKPIVSTVIVSIPAKGPSPIEITKIKAQTRSGMVRRTETNPFVA